LILSLEPTQDQSVFSAACIQDVRDMQINILLCGQLQRHWEASAISTSDLVRWIRSALDCPHLLQHVLAFCRRLAASHPRHQPLQNWITVVKELAMLRTSSSQSDATVHYQQEDESNETDEM